MLAIKSYPFSSSVNQVNNLLLITLAILLAGCKTEYMNRPPGYHKLGKIQDLLAAETNLDANKLLLRRDQKGFYAMSTICTYDLTYLVRKNVGGKDLLVSTYTSSSYELDGKVVSGPAKRDLPYYELKIDSGVYGGARDTLYAFVGKEVSKDWRLEIK